MMFSWFSVIICTVFFFLSLKKVCSGSFSTLHLASVGFYAMQVVPLFVENIYGFDDQIRWYQNMYEASIDPVVHYTYCIFTCVTMPLFYFLGCYMKKRSEPFFTLTSQKKEIHFLLFFILIIGIFLPLFSVVFAPDPSIYLIFGRFYKLSINAVDLPFLYHETVVKQLVYISFLSTVLLYFFNDEKKMVYNVFVFLGVIFVTWFEGKRAFLFFIFLSITAIDIIRNRYPEKKFFFILKNVSFLAISLLFFLAYKEYTGKDAESDFLPQYNLYYSRMSCVKTSIYSALYGQPILQYPGQSLLYDIFFFVPRGFWTDKPAMFVKYFTAFALNRKNVDFLSWNFITNMWCEYIANFGAWGYMLGVSLVWWVAKVTDFTSNAFVRMWGMIFILLYFMFGFEYLVLIVYVLFVMSLISQKIKERL